MCFHFSLCGLLINKKRYPSQDSENFFFVDIFHILFVSSIIYSKMWVQTQMVVYCDYCSCNKVISVTRKKIVSVLYTSFLFHKSYFAPAVSVLGRESH